MSNKKKSMYNYYYVNEFGRLRMINLLEGPRSMIQAEGHAKDEILELMRFNSNVDNENNVLCQNNTYKLLCEKGYLVDETVDEKAKREFIRNDIINNPYLNLVILSTEQCNFRCKYCYEDFKKGKMSDEVQDAIIKFVQKNIQYYTGLNVSWFGGEPLLALDVIENISQKLINICDSAKKRYSASITTNGYYLDLETFTRLNNICRVYKYQITIDGTEKTHDCQRITRDGRPTYARIIENLKQIKLSNNRFYNIIIRTNFTKSIYESIDEYLQLMNDYFSNDDRFTFAVALASDWGGEVAKDFNAEYLDEVVYPDILKKYQTYNNTLCYADVLDNLMSLIGVCYANRRHSYIIGSDGLLYKCSAHFDMPQNQIGYLDNAGNMHIDEHRHAMWVFNDHMNDPGCNNCFFSSVCFGTACPYGNIRNVELKNNCTMTKKFIKPLLEMLPDKYFKIIGGKV